MGEADNSEGPKRPRRITAADVAATAGVSRSAVSRAFNPSAYLEESKRELILKTAFELGYRPNALAASLHGDRSNLVGVVSGNLSNFYDGEVTAALVGALSEARKWPLVLGGENSPKQALLQSALTLPLDALIVRGGSVDPGLVEACSKLNIPIILSGHVETSGQVDCVCCRNSAGTARATQALIAKGRRRIGYIGGPPDWTSEQERQSGVSYTLQAIGLDLAAIQNADYSFDGGYAAAENMFAHADLDGLICANDAMALGALSYLRLHTDLKVPADLSVVGFDDIAMAGWPDNNLTTVRNPQDETVAQILHLLEARLRDPAKPGEVIMIEPQLVERGTH